MRGIGKGRATGLFRFRMRGIRRRMSGNRHGWMHVQGSSTMLDDLRQLTMSAFTNMQANSRGRWFRCTLAAENLPGRVLPKMRRQARKSSLGRVAEAKFRSFVKIFFRPFGLHCGSGKPHFRVRAMRIFRDWKFSSGIKSCVRTKWRGAASRIRACSPGFVGKVRCGRIDVQMSI